MYILQAPWQDLCPIFTNRVLIKFWSIQQGCKSSRCLGNQEPFSPSSISRSSIPCQNLILTSHIEKYRCHFNTCDLINGHVCKCKTVITKLTHHPAWQIPAQWCTAESFLQHNPHHTVVWPGDYVHLNTPCNSNFDAETYWNYNLSVLAEMWLFGFSFSKLVKL